MSKVPREQIDLCFDSNSVFGDLGREKSGTPDLADVSQPSGTVLRFRTRESATTQKSMEMEHGFVLQRLLRRVSKF